MNPLSVFIFHTRDAWGRPVRRLDHNALAVTVLASGLGTIVLWAATSDVLCTTVKLTHRLVQSF